MSKRAIGLGNLVMEWSPRGIVIYDPATRSIHNYASAADAAVLGNRTVVVAFSRRSVFVRTLRVPNGSLDEISMIVRMKLPDLFPLPAHELAYDVELTDDINEEGRLALIAAIPAADLRRMRDEMKATGFRVQRVVPVSYGSVLLADTLGRPNCAVVSRDEEGIGIDIVQGGELRYSRVAGLHSAPTAEVCRTYSVVGLPCGEIVAADGVEVEDADALSPMSPLEALAGIWPDRLQLDIELPELLATRAARIRSRRQRLALMLFFGAVLLAAYAYIDYNDRLAAVRVQQQANTKAISNLTAIQNKAESDANAATKLEQSVKRGFEPAQRLSDIVLVASNRTPEGVWLTGVTVERGKQIMLRGTSRSSDSVAEYLRRMTAEPRFRDVKLVFANNGVINETTVVQFSISAFPVGNLPLVDINAPRTKR